MICGDDFVVKKSDVVVKETANIEVSSIFEYVNIFINDNIETICDYNTASVSFKKIVDFMKENNLMFTPQLCILLLDNNEIINKIFKIIVKKYYSKIVNNDYETLFDGYDLLFIDLYCSKNNIDIIGIDINDELLISKENEYDPLKIYLSSLGLPILSAEEQLELGKIVALGRKDNATKEEKKAAKRAKDKLITHNMRLSFSIAKKYSKNLPEVSVNDLAQEGYFGLEKAILKYDPTLGVKFSTYATFWIRQKITCYICEMLQLSQHLENYFIKYSKAYSEFVLENEQEPTLEEIAEKINAPVHTLKRIETAVATKVSLNTKIDDDQNRELGEVLPSKILPPDEEYERKEAEETIKKILDELALSDPRYKFVIIHRNGLFGESEKTLAQVRDLLREKEKSLGLKSTITTGERIRQIEISALELMAKIGKKYLSTQPRHDKTVSTICPSTPFYCDNSNIFTVFLDYSEEDVLKAIYMLPIEDINLILERYGEDLHKPIMGQYWNYTKEEIFVRNIIPKIKNNLLRLCGKKEEDISYNSELKLRVLINKLANDDIDEIEEKDVRLLQSLLNDNLFLEYISKLTLVENQILIRRLQYENNIFTSISKICEETGIDRKIVEECIKKHFVAYNNLRTIQIKKYYNKK